jgi:hypothetical protein
MFPARSGVSARRHCKSIRCEPLGVGRVKRKKQKAARRETGSGSYSCPQRFRKESRSLCSSGSLLAWHAVRNAGHEVGEESSSINGLGGGNQVPERPSTGEKMVGPQIRSKHLAGCRVLILKCGYPSQADIAPIRSRHITFTDESCAGMSVQYCQLALFEFLLG